MKVLDLDMDYFMDRVATDVPFEIVDRLSEEEYGGFVWTERRIRQFLEVNLGLSKLLAPGENRHYEPGGNRQS